MIPPTIEHYLSIGSALPYEIDLNRVTAPHLVDMTLLQALRMSSHPQPPPVAAAALRWANWAR